MDLSDLLECSVCLEQLSHLNKVLPCQHTFCTQCLKVTSESWSHVCQSNPCVCVRMFTTRGRSWSARSAGRRSRTLSTLSPPTSWPTGDHLTHDTTRGNVTSTFDRILESMGQHQPQPRPVSAPSVPALPLPRRPPLSVTESLVTPPAPLMSVKQLPVIQPPVIKAPVMKPPVISPPLLSPSQAAPSIPGNHHTNPFLDLINASSYYDQQMELCSKMSKSQIQEQRTLTTKDDQIMIASLPRPTLAPPRPPSSLTPSSSLISSPSQSSPGPPLPDRNKVKQHPAASHVVPDPTKQWQLSPRAILDPPRSSVKTSSSSASVSSSASSQVSPVYRAVFEYEAVQKDELSLRKGELYTVMDRCHDGWFKGKNVKTGETGVFPGNYVKEYDGKQVQ